MYANRLFVEGIALLCLAFFFLLSQGWSFCQLSLRTGSGMEIQKVSEKRRFRDACDTWGETAAQGPHGERGWEGGEKLEESVDIPP